MPWNWHPNYTYNLETDPQSLPISTPKVSLCKNKQTWTFQRRIQLSHSRPLKLWTTPIALHTATLQHLHAPHTLIPLPRAQTNFSCFQTLSLPEPAVAIKDIHPSAQDDYDWSRHQTINLYHLSLSLLLFFSSLSLFVSFTSFSCYFVDVQNMMKKWECGSLWHRGMWE